MNQGNGSHCDDVDECQEQGGQHGHHCPTENARCKDECHHDDHQNHHQQLYHIYHPTIVSRTFLSLQNFPQITEFCILCSRFFSHLSSMPIRAIQIEICSIWYLIDASQKSLALRKRYKDKMQLLHFPGFCHFRFFAFQQFWRDEQSMSRSRPNAPEMWLHLSRHNIKIFVC